MTTQPGEREAWFRSQVAQYEGPLVRYTTRIVGNVEVAREVVQEAFLRLHEAESAPESGQAWLYTVCRRRAIDVRRKEGRMKVLENGHAAVCELPGAERGDAVERAETRSAVTRLLAELPANQQEVVRLKFQDGLSYRDIATVTGLSVTNVGYLLHVAVKRLRERLVPGH